MQSNIIGSNGIRLSMKARNDDGSLDILANRQIEQQWQNGVAWAAAQLTADYLLSTAKIIC
ncbi:MAG: hypothetical protein CM15mV144_470 [Caudoviricetes sp.]|nr:MAG: hypothetical protein CM15mV144_470 [Caudoviricetes sp.]